MHYGALKDFSLVSQVVQYSFKEKHMKNFMIIPSLANQICTLQIRAGNGKGVSTGLAAWSSNTVLYDIIVKYCTRVLNRSR